MEFLQSGFRYKQRITITNKENSEESETNKNEEPIDWAQRYWEPVLYPITYEIGCKEYHLRTGDPKIARRLRRRKAYTEMINKVLWSPFSQWYFMAEFSSRRNAIRSLSRVLKKPCKWDQDRWEIRADEDT